MNISFWHSNKNRNVAFPIKYHHNRPLNRKCRYICKNTGYEKKSNLEQRRQNNDCNLFTYIINSRRMDVDCLL